MEFIDVVDKVLTRLKERNGVVSKDKIRLGFGKMVALGFDVGLHEYSPKHALKKKVLECTMPTNKTRSATVAWTSGAIRQAHRPTCIKRDSNGMVAYYR